MEPDTARPTSESPATLASGQDTDPVLEELAALHVPHDTCPAAELLELASDATDESGATPDDPIDFEKIRERFLAEHCFSGKNEHQKNKCAITAAAMIHGGFYSDLLDDAAWWRTDDLWVTRLLADRTHPPESRAPVQTLAIPPEVDRPFAALTDGEVDGPGRPWPQRNDGRLASLSTIRSVRCPWVKARASILVRRLR